MITFTIPGRIRGKQRPRVVKRGNFVRTYTPIETENAEAMVRDFAAKAMAGRALFQGPVALRVEISMNTPVSWSKKRRAAAYFVMGKPDYDNQIKLLSDSMNGVVYKDDSQIADAHITRRYDDGAPESVVVVVTPLTSETIRRPDHALKATPLFREVAA